VTDGDVIRHVRVVLNVLTSRARVRVDNAEVVRRTAWGLRNRWPVAVGERTALLTIVTFPAQQFSLVVDGTEVPPAGGVGGSTGLASPMPKWAWAFVVACLLLPIATVGGGLPMALGVGGATAVASASRGKGSSGRKIAICLAITIGIWVAAAAVVLAIAGARGGK
jgi:hypothetical protein